MSKGTKKANSRASSASPYVRAGNLFFIPVLRHRLAFAEAVRQTIYLLDREEPWDPRRDLLVVTLPESMKVHMISAIARLPKVSLLVTTDRSSGPREVYGISPCDAFVEAVRTATQSEWPVEFVDLELAAGNLQRNPCIQDPNWPDDALVEALGIENYFKLIEGYFVVSPARLEPVDSWREAAVATRIRQFSPIWRRMIVVIDAGIYRTVSSQLRYQVSTEASSQLELSGCAIEIRKNLSLQILLHYLDDYPRLIERYEKCRSRDGPFNKYEQLWSEIVTYANAQEDMKFSLRQYSAFSNLLRNLLILEHRAFPKPDLLRDAVAGCLGSAFAERLASHLVGYATQIRAVERVVPRSTVGPVLTRFEVEGSARGGYVSRACDPHMPRYAVVRPVEERLKSSSNTVYSWKFDQIVIRRLNERLPRIASESAQKRALPFDGAIRGGIDVRRTIPSLYKRNRALYVKASRVNRDPSTLLDEPIVWILTDDLDQRGEFVSSGFNKEDMELVTGRNKDAYYIASLDAYSIKSVRSKDVAEEGATLVYADHVVRVVFGTRFDDEKVAREYFEKNFELRFPNHSEFEHPSGCVHRDFMTQSNFGLGWLTIALLTAAKYAERVVNVVAPNGFYLPRTVLSHPASASKEFKLFSIGRFSKEEREMIGTIYHFKMAGEDDRRARAAFRLAMRRYWDYLSNATRNVHPMSPPSP